jgi:hypothetical protein
MSWCKDNSYRQNVIADDDVSKPPIKNTKAWAAREFIERPIKLWISTPSLNIEVELIKANVLRRGFFFALNCYVT